MLMGDHVGPLGAWSLEETCQMLELAALCQWLSRNASHAMKSTKAKACIRMEHLTDRFNQVGRSRGPAAMAIADCGSAAEPPSACSSGGLIE